MIKITKKSQQDEILNLLSCGNISVRLNVPLGHDCGLDK